LAQGELRDVEDDLEKLSLQKHILEQRQSDLGRFIGESMKKHRAERNPTVDEVSTFVLLCSSLLFTYMCVLAGILLVSAITRIHLQNN
jgi:hypothetical protein